MGIFAVVSFPENGLTKVVEYSVTPLPLKMTSGPRSKDGEPPEV
jgi:hypothetical protein